MLEKRVSFAFRLTSLMTDLVDELEKIKDRKNLENVIILLDEAISNNKNNKYFSIKKAAKILQDNYFAELYHQCELISSLNEEINEYFKEMFKRYFDENNRQYVFFDYYYKNLVVCPDLHEEFMNIIINKKLGKDIFDDIDFFQINNTHIRYTSKHYHDSDYLLKGYMKMIELYKHNIDYVDLDEI